MTTSKQEIKSALQRFTDGNFAENARYLFEILGYRSQRAMDLEYNTAEEFLEVLDRHGKVNQQRALLNQWDSIHILLQLKAEQIRENGVIEFASTDADVDSTYIESYLFLALKLRGDNYTRTHLSQITREINRPFDMPAMILFQHGETLTFAVIDRRRHKRDRSKDVLEKATLIKDIGYTGPRPHPAHVNILFDLSIAELHRKHQFANFKELHDAWKKTLDTSELNKRFYREIANWYFWAVNQVTFPDNAGEDVEVRNATSVIRLITRLIFVWFIKEKGLVPDALFAVRDIKTLLHNTEPDASTYYKAILQNLFFATLNQEMNTEEKPNNRKFRIQAKQSGDRDQNYMAHSLYRYENCFKDKQNALELFGDIPFLNGGLFECLDKLVENDSEKDNSKKPNSKEIRIDGFSDHKKNPLIVPNFLFFSDEQSVDLNAAYGTRGKNYKVRGLINIFDSYKFTVTENTPIEEEVALDPELLGKVFENLLAAYNPETGMSARKQSGSYYTPREIVNYMTDESLIAYLKHKCIAYRESQSAPSPTTPPAQLDLSGRMEPVQTQIDTRGVKLSDEQKDQIEKDLRHLLAYNDAPHRFSPDEIEVLINAVDSLKILDPACGSGAFPMGVLHKLVFILSKLDPGNVRWKERQIEKACEIPDPTTRDKTIDDIEAAFESNELDYGRKLYLIQNCIFGVDIQPIAVQIAKLRFFISLVVDQQLDDSANNRGVRPLPNLETKFVAANTLIDITGQLSLRSSEIRKREIELQEVRRRHFTARTPTTKRRYRERDAELRAEIGALLSDLGLPKGTADEIARWDPYDQNAFAVFFNPDWMFGLSQGYDVVIGNPPYINIENLQSTIKDYLFKNFQTCQGRTDIYIAFLEKSMSILRGIMCFILPSAFATQKYGKKLRQMLIGHYGIREVVDASSYRIFENATVYNIVLMVGKEKEQNEETKVKLHSSNSDFETRGGREFYVNQQLFSKLKDSRFETDPLVFDGLKVQAKIWQHSVRFDRICFVAYGARLNHRSENLGKQHYISQSQTPGAKRFCEGKNIERYTFSQAGWLDYTPDEHYNSMFPELFANRKLMSINVVKDRLRFAYDDKCFFNSHTVINCVRLDLLSHASHVSARRAFRNADKKFAKQFSYGFLLGVLNSTPINWYFRSFLSESLHFYPNDAKQLPIPSAMLDQQTPVSRLANQILDTKRIAPNADVSELENEIDRIVYSLYNLTPEEIAIIETSDSRGD
ncbi:MAG: Eco57I restriction-modification methylase domain-containing protein [Candidatus Poribacteria bacterium]|nr:Eco57I restriction-modification methylase domain-containing protein [Candidatus Poribacteria bacterium]